MRRLERVGVPSEQAEAQAEVLSEAFNVNLEELVNKDYFESRLDVRFAQQLAMIDKRFAEQSANFKVLYWILSIIFAATIIPLLGSLITL